MLATLTLALALHAGSARILDPAVYTSPSGEYSLGIAPLTRSGYGAAEYELKQNGQRVWASQLDFAMRGPRITDQGVALGYAVRARQPEGAGEDFLVIDLDASGNATVLERVRHVQSEFSSECWPEVRGLLVDAPNDHFTLRVKEKSGMGPETWWRYQISSGERLPFHEPHDDGIVEIYGDQGLVGAIHVRGTPLDLLLWSPSRLVTGVSSSADFLTLNTFDGQRIWKFELPAEDSKKTAWSRGVLASEGPGRFSFWDKPHGEVLHFHVEAAQGPGSIWHVDELSREARAWAPSYFNRAEKREEVVLVEADSLTLSGPPADPDLLPGTSFLVRLANGGVPQRIPSADKSMFLAPHDFHAVVLETSDGEPLAVLDCHVDRTWVRSPSGACFGASRDVWVLDDIGHTFDDRSVLTRYDLAGTPLSSLPIKDSFGTDATLSAIGHLVLISPGGPVATLVDTTTGALTDVRIGTESASPHEQWKLVLAQDGEHIHAYAANGQRQLLCDLPGQVRD